MSDSGPKVIVTLLATAAVAAAVWHYRDYLLAEPEPQVVVDAPAIVEAPVDTGPKFPIAAPVPEDSGARSLVPLPGLDDSDAFFLLEVGYAFGPAIESLLVREAVIDRLVTSIDNLPRPKLSEKIRPVGRLPDEFDADSDADDAVVLGTSSYSRYDGIVAQIDHANIDTVYDTYRRFYPLFQSSYERLGYPDAYFNDRLIEVIDHLLATPEHNGPIVLVRPNVLYMFADPDLEALSSGQKLMLRMGPENRETIKKLLEDFRNRLTASD